MDILTYSTRRTNLGAASACKRGHVAACLPRSLSLPTAVLLPMLLGGEKKGCEVHREQWAEVEEARMEVGVARRTQCRQVQDGQDWRVGGVAQVCRHALCDRG